MAGARSCRWGGTVWAVPGALLLATVFLCLAVPPPAQARPSEADFDVDRYLPPDSVAAIRGREVAMRFGLGRRFELTLQVNNVFAAQNRRALARAESMIAAIPGVRRVVGPSGLLTIGLDAAGRPSAVPLLAGGPGEDANEAVRQRLIRRSDAIGWFIAREGTAVRLLIDTDNIAAIQTSIENTAASSGLVLLSGVAPASPLWPEPERRPRPFAPWLPFLLMAGAMLPGAWAAAASSRPTIARGVLVSIATGAAASAPAILAPAEGLRQVALWGGCVAGSLVAILIAGFRINNHGGAAGHFRQTRRLRVPLAILVPAILLVVGAAVLSPRVFLGTQLWRQTSVFFLEVRGDMDEPVVLRELRRMTDFLRAEPGVAHAWSIADLFFAVPTGGENFGGIPSDGELARAIMAQARDDAAVRLELAPDHRGALVGVRLDDESGVDRLTVLEQLDQYLSREHRWALRRVNVLDPRVAPAVRGLGRGILAADTRERVLRICERSGRMLSEADVQTIDQAARRATLVPVVDPVKLKAEIAQDVTVFLERAAIAAAQVTLPRPPERQRLVDVLAAQPVDATVTEVWVALRELWGKRLPDVALSAQATALHRRLVELRRRHTARINFRDLLYGADLPTEGVLSEEVRDATLDAMGPVAGIPTGADVPGAFFVEPLAVGGAPSDRALSAAWLPLMMLGLLIASLFTALLLEAIGGIAALAWWPVALAPAAPLFIFPAVANLPLGVLYLAVLSGALAGGVALAVAFAPGRRDQ